MWQRLTCHHTFPFFPQLDYFLVSLTEADGMWVERVGTLNVGEKIGLTKLPTDSPLFLSLPAG